MVIDYDGSTYEFHDGNAGIHHRAGSFVDSDTAYPNAGREEFRGVKFVAWVTQEVNHCIRCGFEPVISTNICPRFDESGQRAHHAVIPKERKREVEIWLTYDQAFALGLSLMRDFSLGRYGVG